MFDTRIKICGITSAADATLSLALGADYLGLLFVDSARRVTLETARSIRAAVPNALLVGVFMDAPLDDVVATTKECSLNMIQLHGAESPDYCDALMTRISLPLIKSFSLARLRDTRQMPEYRRISYFHFDLDKNTPLDRNGTVSPEQERLWQHAAVCRAKGYRIFVAGALNPANVRRAVGIVRPFGVDIASGVEKRPGVKDAAALRRLIEEVHR